MLFLVVGGVTACFWLLFYPPDHLSGRARAGLLVSAMIATAVCTWSMVATMNAMEGARQRALEQVRADRALKRRYLEQFRQE